MSQGRELVVKRGPGRPPRHSAAFVAAKFAFKTGDLVLVKWNDGMVYFAKIKRIDHKRHKCVVVFDDKSQDEAHFSQIHSVDETTTDIICIKCKKDDSDKPNEIVLCDTCGIGFHQKCHAPNIPASALELNTPWNCSYCQKGVKCPYLTESLDVLQNLLSDDEDNSIADDVDSVAVVESDHFENHAVVDTPQVSPRKKRGRKPPLTSALTSEVTTAGKRERRKVQASLQPQQSPDVEPLDNTTSRTCSEAWKPKTYPHEESDSDAVYLSSGRSTPEAPSHVGIKRRKHHSTQIKKQKRSSVESRTMSVTRLPMSVCENSSAEEMDTSRDSSMSDAPPVANHSLSSIKEEGGPHNMKRPRTLRVSLSIPDDVEPGTPFDKVVKAHQKTCSPQLNVETKELPSWENFANSNMIKASSPKQRPRTLPNDLLNSKPRSTSVSSSAKEEAGSSSHPPSAFLASPLPISSSAKVHPPVNLSVPVTNVKTNGSVTSPTVGGKVCTPVISSPATAVGYSASSLLRESGADGGATAAKPVSVVVKESEVTQHQTPNQPTQRNPLLQPKPQSSKPGHSQQTISSGATPGIAQASTTLPLSLATKPTVVATATAADSLSGNKLNSYNLQRGTPTQAPPLPPPKAQKPHPVLVSQSPVTSAVVKQVIVSKPHISAQQASMSSSTPLTQSVAAHSQVSSQLPTQRVLMAPSRPSSVPTQQHVSVAPPPPPRPSSVPTQQQVLVTQSHPLKSAPPQRVLVATSQPLPSSFSAPVQQLVTVTQKPYYVSKGAPSATVSGHHTSTSQTAPSLSSAAPSGVIYSSPDLLQTQHVAQEPHQQQAMPPKAAVPTKSAGDADVIITGVETSGIRRGSVGSDRTVGTGSTGERTVVVSSLVPEAGIASGAGPGRKVLVDAQQVAAPGGSNPGGSLVTTPAGSHTPVSVVPVVITPTAADLTPTQVLYHLPDPHALPPTQGPQPPRIIREVPVHSPPLKSTPSTKPAAPSATTVIVACSPTVTTNVAESSASPLPGTVVYSAIGPNVAAFSGVNTTKPYAIVNAMPGTQIVYTTSQGAQPSHVGGGVVTGPVGSLPQPPKTYSLISEKQNAGGKLHHRDVVETISKKIGDAFDSGNEQLLVAAFEDAWKKFQANGKQYEHGVITSAAKTSLGKEPLAPNAEVFCVPGTGSRVTLVRQTSTNSGGNRLLAPKTTSPLPVQHLIAPAPPPLSSQPQTKYVYTAANAVQPQVYLQPVTVSSSFPSGQQQPPNPKFQTTGLFYPPSSTTAPQKKTTVGTGIQRVIVSQSAPVVQHSVSSCSSDKTQETNRKPRERSSKSKVCSRCGKSATYLCSGCHAEWYCGRECQLKAWDAHADSCKA